MRSALPALVLTLVAASPQAADNPPVTSDGRYWEGMSPALFAERQSADKRAAREAQRQAVLLGPRIFGPSLENHRTADPTWLNVRCDQPNIGNAAETFIDASPVSNQNLIAGANVIAGWPNLSGCFYSTNGGATFANATIPNINISGTTYTSWGDPMTTWDASGVAYYFSLGIAGSNPTALYGSRSFNNGANWQAGPLIEQGAATDKEFSCCDLSTSSPYFNRVYVAWRAATGSILVKSSSNQITSYSTAAVASIGAGAPPQFCTVATGPNGEVYVGFVSVSTTPQRLYVSRSTNGGASFSSSQIVHTFIGGGGGGFQLPPMPPCLAVDNSSGPNRGTVYISYDDRIVAGGDWDVFVRRSYNAGSTWPATWQPPVRVNDDNVCNGRRQNYTFVRTGRNDGAVTAYWYDFRHATGDFGYYYAAQSFDGGATFEKNVRVSDYDTYVCPTFTSSSACRNTDGRFVGDYVGGAMSDVSVYPVWADSRIGSQLNAHTYTQRLPHPIPQAMALAPSSANPGQSLSVTIGGNRMAPQGATPTSIVFSSASITGTISGGTGTSVTVSINVGGAVAPGDYDLTLVYPNGSVKCDPVHFTVYPSSINTFTHTRTATAQCTPTVTFTNTQTMNGSPTTSLTPTETRTVSPSGSPTMTRTGSVTRTVTPTRTQTETETHTASPSLTSTETPVGPFLYPNPWVRADGPLRLRGAALDTVLTLYNVAGEFVHSVSTLDQDSLEWDGVLQSKVVIARGTYPYRLSSPDGPTVRGVLSIR